MILQLGTVIKIGKATVEKERAVLPETDGVVKC